MPNEMGPQMCLQLKAIKVAPSSFSSKVCRLVRSSNQTAAPIFKVDLRLETSETWQLYEVAIVKEDYRDLYEVAGSASLPPRGCWLGRSYCDQLKTPQMYWCCCVKLKSFPGILKGCSLFGGTLRFLSHTFAALLPLLCSGARWQLERAAAVFFSSSLSLHSLLFVFEAHETCASLIFNDWGQWKYALKVTPPWQMAVLCIRFLWVLQSDLPCTFPQSEFNTVFSAELFQKTKGGWEVGVGAEIDLYKDAALPVNSLTSFWSKEPTFWKCIMK